MFHSIINRSSTIVVDELKIRLVTCKDAENIAIYYQKNRSHLQPWEPTREENFFTVAGWEKRLEQIAILHRHEMAYYFIVTPRHSNQVLAVINFSNVIKSPFYACHVGYSLDSEYQGKGIMRRALQATINWLFEEKYFHRIIAVYMPHNEKSANVLYSVGFEKEGEAKDYLLINGQWRDHILTAKINPNWREPIKWNPF